MQTHKAHCSALGRTVDLAIADQPVEESGASAPISAIVCLDRGPHCTGATCPITGATPAVMTLRLARSNLAPGAEEVVARNDRRPCDGSNAEESDGRGSAKK